VDGLRVVASAASQGKLADQLTGPGECRGVVILDLYCGGDAPCLEAVGQLGASARVLVMSASGWPADVLGAIEAGAAGYIAEQADGLMVVSAAETVARGGFWLSAELADMLQAELSRTPQQGLRPARPSRRPADLSPRE
jgi:two-component system nitrate/nitrite response regulator NarL